MDKMCPMLTAARDIALAVLDAKESEMCGTHVTPADRWEHQPVPCQGDRCMWWVEGAFPGEADHCGVSMIGPGLIPEDDPFPKEDEDNGT